jgi:hypothetical protein
MRKLSLSAMFASAGFVLSFAAAGCGGSNTDTDGRGGASGTGGGSGSMAGASSNPNLAKFSFFVISVDSVRELAKSQDGFGGDLRFGETGEGAGLRGADKICAAAAEIGMKGAGQKTWRAFLSATSGGPGGGAVNAKDRVGNGPWYDATGRLIASDLSALLADRPEDADLAVKNDLPNEFGTPNHCGGGMCADNHQVLTGTAADGTLYTGTTPTTDATCDDWTSAEPSGHPRAGHSWPRAGSGTNWISAYDATGCAPCALAVGSGAEKCVGATGGYGGFYCLAVNE